MTIGTGTQLKVMLALILVLTLMMLGACTSGDEAADSDLATPTVGVLPTATTAPLPSPTPAVPDSGQGPIIVGSLMAESGVMVKRDTPALEGARVQVERLNDDGGLMGRSIEFIQIDSESRLGTSADGASELVRRGADLALVSCDPVRAAPAIEVLTEAGILVISPCAADEAWFVLDDLVFSMSNSAVHEGRVLAEWAMDNDLTSTAAVLDKTNPDVETFCAAFLEHYRSLGGTVLWTDEFTFDSLDPFEDRLIQRPKQMASVLLCSHLPGGLNGAPNIIELVRSSGIEVPFLAGSSLDGGPTWFNIVNDLRTLIMVSPASIHGDDPNPAVQSLIDAVNGEGSIPPARGWSHFGAESVQAWALAVDRAQSVDGVLLAQELERFRNEPLLASTVSFGPDSHMDSERELRIIRIADGAASLVEVR